MKYLSFLFCSLLMMGHFAVSAYCLPKEDSEVVAAKIVAKIPCGMNLLVGKPAVAADGMAYIANTLGRLFAVDTQNEQVKWTYLLGGRVFSSPVLDAGAQQVYLGNNSGYVVSLDATSGEQTWVVNLKAAVRFSPAVSNGVVYVSCDDGTLYALDAANDGTTLWQVPVGTPLLSSPVVGSQTSFIYVASEGGRVHAVDTSGTIIWSQTFSDSFSAAPIASNGVVYVAGEFGHLCALNATDGQEIWRIALSPGRLGSPLLVASNVIVGSDLGHLMAVQESDGTFVWQQASVIGGMPKTAASATTLYVAQKELRALDPKNGDKLWEILSGVGFGAPTFANMLLYASLGTQLAVIMP